MEQRKKLGEIFVAKGILTAKTVDRVLVTAKRVNKRFGTVLEEMELVTGEELASALATQYNLKVVSSFSGHAFPELLLDLIPVEVAMQNLLFPLKIESNRLALAMADPTNTRIVDNIAANNGLTVFPFVATRKDIHAAICRNYLGKEAPSESGEVKILVAAGDMPILSTVKDFLARRGYHVVTAMDGIEAYKAVITEKPHTIIADRDLHKLDAYGLLDALRNVPELKVIPVILVSGLIGLEDEAKAFNRGFFDFIPKPLKELTLIARVKRALQFYDHKYQIF